MSFLSCIVKSDIGDTETRQKGIERLGNRARKWVMRFQSFRCNMTQLTRNGIKKPHAVHTVEETVLETVEGIKYSWYQNQS